MHVNLVPRLVWGDVDLTESPFMLLMDPDFSQGENLYEVLETELFDGSSVSSESTDNRTPTFRVAIIDEPDQEGLALAGARLDREAEKARNLLTFDPGDGFGTPWSVETYRAQTRVERLDDLEQSMIRIYEIEMPAYPHVRSVEPVVIPATGSGDPTPPPVVVDAPSSATGWSATVAGSTVAPVWAGIGVLVSAPVLRTQLLRDPLFKQPSEYWLPNRHSGASFGGDGSAIVWSDIPAGSFAMFSSIMPVTAGQSYTSSALLDSPAGSVNAGTRLQIRWYDSSSTLISTSQSAALPANPSGYASVTATAPSGATQARWGVAGSISRRGIPWVLLVREVLFERASSRLAWFSGDSPVAGGVGYLWTGARDASTSIQVPAGASTLQRTGLSEDFTSTPYAHVTFSASHLPSTIAATVNDVEVPLVTVVPTVGGYRAVFEVGAVAAATSMTFSLGGSSSAAPSWFMVSRIERSTSASPYLGTERQLFRSFEAHGTARTSGSLRLSHTNPLGSVLVWSGVDGGTGYQPPMRGYKSGGEVDVADTAAASGARTDISASPFAVSVPVDQLPPGLYRVAARVRSDTTGTAYFTRTYTTLGSPLTPLPVTTTVTQPHDLTATYRIVNLGTEMISGSYGSAMERMMAVQATGTGTGTVWLDELYLLNTSTGSVVQVEAGACTRLWINAPTVDAPFPTMLGGTQADGSDAVRLDTVADIFQPAAWPPGMINLFTVCGQPNLAAKAEYYPRFLHNAYEVAA